MALWVLGLVFLALVGGDKGGVLGNTGKGSCGFPAIYNFGDGNSDTGEYAVAFGNEGLPNGQTFFGKPSGRYCDGRLIIDFIAEHLGFPLLSGYMDSFGSNYSHGANFAMEGAGIVDNFDGTASPFPLSRQVFQFSQFKSRTTALFNQLSAESKDTTAKSILPRPEHFANALYMIDIGQIDFLNKTLSDYQTRISGGPTQLFDLISLLHEWDGARFFWIHNAGPVGCLPYVVKACQKQNVVKCDLDQNGCLKEKNELAQEFNKLLKQKVSEARTKFPNATFTYVDVYSAKYNLISNARNLGFEEPGKFCCGSYENNYIACGQKDSSGKVIGSAYADPSKYIFWDGLHYSEAANQFVAKLILNGSLSDPPVPLPEACRKP